MSSAVQKFEKSKVNEVARDYRSRGYRVEVRPKGNAIPSFLRDLDYQPDLVAESDDEKLVVEVKTRESMHNDRKLSLVSSAVESSGEWKFVLIYANPKGKSLSVTIPPSLDTDEIESAVRYALSLASGSNDEYARVTSLLLMWSAVEASLRSFSFEGQRLDTASPRSLIRDAVTLGLVDPDSYDRVVPIIEKRNSAAHGNLLVEVDRSEIEMLAGMCREIVGYGQAEQNREAHG